MPIQLVFTYNPPKYGNQYSSRLNQHFRIRQLNEVLGKEGYSITLPKYFLPNNVLKNTAIEDFEGLILEIKDEKYLLLIRLDLERYTNLKLKSIFKLDEEFWVKIKEKKSEIKTANKLKKESKEYQNILVSYSSFIQGMKNKIDKFDLEKSDPLYVLKAEVQEKNFGKRTSSAFGKKIKQIDSDIEKINESIKQLFNEKKIA